MNYARRSHASCALGKFLYVFFGYPEPTSIERLNVEDSYAAWEIIDLQGESLPFDFYQITAIPLNQS